MSPAGKRLPRTEAQMRASFSADGSRSMRVTSSDSTVAGIMSGASRTTQRRRPGCSPSAGSATRMPRSTSASIISRMNIALPPVRDRMWRASSRAGSSGVSRLITIAMRDSSSSSSMRTTTALRALATCWMRCSGREVKMFISPRVCGATARSPNISRLWSSAQWASSTTTTSGRSGANSRSSR